MNLDHIIKIFGLFYILTGAAIYTFSIGYLDALGIPELPSFWEALTLFVSSVYGLIVERLEGQSSIIVFVTVPVFLLVLYEIKNPNGSRQKKLGSWIIITFAIGGLFYLLKNSLLYILWVILPPNFIVLAIVILGNFKKLKTKGSFFSKSISMFLVLIILTIISWIQPYKIGNQMVLESESIKDSFPKGWSGVGDVEESYLLWQTNSKSYWLLCGLQERVIYAKTDSGNRTFTRTLTPILESKFCN